MGYVAHYLGTEQLPKTELINYLKANGDENFLTRWRLSGTSKNIKKVRNCPQLIAAYKVHICDSGTTSHQLKQIIPYVKTGYRYVLLCLQ